MSRWSSLIRSFTQLFSDVTERRKDDERSRKAAEGIAKLAHRVMVRRVNNVVPPPVQDYPGYLPKKPRSGNWFEDQQINDQVYDDVEVLGRDASYDQASLDAIQANSTRVVSSSNVYSYAWEPEGPDPKKGILYVTFLNWEQGQKNEDRTGPGSTYAYYDFPQTLYEEFNEQAEESAGKAVWDFCRVRGSVWAHQHRYRLIATGGEYIPRKATKRGFKRRTMIPSSISLQKRKALAGIAKLFTPPGGKPLLPEAFKRSTLEEHVFRAKPNRGTPNRGRPNRGR